MKRIFLSGFLAAALIFSACDQQSSVNSPTDTGNDSYTSLTKLADQLDLTEEQIAYFDEMFYLDEDMSILIPSDKVLLLDNAVDGFGSKSLDSRHGRKDRRHALDVAAIIYYRLILKACPDIADELKEQIKDLIAESNKARIDFIKENAGNPDVIKELLKAEHDALMVKINALLSQTCLDAIEALKEEIKQKREERREKWVEKRIEMQVKFMTRLLGLTDEQAAKLMEILQWQHEQIQTLREQFKDDPEGFKNALKELQEQVETKISTELGLTDEQIEKWEKWKKLRNRIIHHRR